MRDLKPKFLFYKMEINKLKSMLGFAAKARKLAAGAELTLSAIRGKKAQLVLVAADVSENTRKRLTNCCEFYETECFAVGFTIGELGHIIGKHGGTACLAVIDSGFAQTIRNIINDK